MRRIAMVLLMALSAITAPLAARAGEAEQKRAADAARVLREVMTAPDKAIPKDLLREARAIVVVPDVVKAGLGLGGHHGAGLLSVKTREGAWSNPSFINLTGSSIGYQAGVSPTDVILVFRTERGVGTIAHGKLTLGADASVAAGPVGRSARAATDAQSKAEILAYAHASGLFAGAALDGAALTIDNDANQAVYGPDITPQRIFAGGMRDVPKAVVDFRERLDECTVP